MPSIGTDGRTGGGYDPKTRLDLAGIQGGKDSDPITRAEMRDVMRQITDWSNRLRFGRVGFTVEQLPLTAPGIVSNVPVQFNRVVEDSSSFTKTYMPGDELTYMQVPPGLGAVYAVSYNMDFALITAVTTTFAVTGAVQSWAAPAGLLFNTATIRCRGGAGFYSGSSSQNRQGFGQDVTATFHNITPGASYDVYVGRGNGNGTSPWFDGGAGGNNTGPGGSLGGPGGDSSQVRPAGGAIGTALIIGGGGGGPGAGLVAAHNAFGGDAGLPSGAAGQGYAQAGVNAGGGTATAGGTAGTGGEAGDTDFTGAGGDAPATASGFAFPGGGGGGGWHGGGSGGTAPAAGNRGGGGGGGSSRVNGGTDIITASGGSNTGLVSITYYTSTPAASTDVVTKVWVAYADWPDAAPYAQVVNILGDSGTTPHNASISIPLGEGDRIWMTYTVALATVGDINFNFSAYSTGT